MNARRAAIAFVLVLTLGGAGLVLAGSRAHHARAFSLNVPYLQIVATLRRGEAACASPISEPSAFGGVRVWARGVGAPGALRVRVSDAATGRLEAMGRILVAQPLGAVSGMLDASVPGGVGVRVCLAGASAAPVQLAGGPPFYRSVHLRIGGQPSQQQFSLVTLESRPRSFLSLVPRIFRRAALFHPSWVGAWTFWVLGILMVASFLGLGVAVWRVTVDEGMREGG